jgi:hypothetical protein
VSALARLQTLHLQALKKPSPKSQPFPAESLPQNLKLARHRFL